jgi:hypothetical protein
VTSESESESADLDRRQSGSPATSLEEVSSSVSLPEYHDGATVWRDLIDKLEDADTAKLRQLEAGDLDTEDLLDLARHRIECYALEDEVESDEPMAVCGIPRWIYLSGQDPRVRAFVDRPSSRA